MEAPWAAPPPLLRPRGVRTSHASPVSSCRLVANPESTTLWVWSAGKPPPDLKGSPKKRFIRDFRDGIWGFQAIPTIAWGPRFEGSLVLLPAAAAALPTKTPGGITPFAWPWQDVFLPCMMELQHSKPALLRASPRKSRKNQTCSSEIKVAS